MADYNQKIAAQPVQTQKAEKVSMMRMVNGKLQMVRVSENRHNELKNAGAERMSAYLDAAFKEKPDAKIERLNSFESTWHKTACLLCADNGYHSVPIQAPNGGNYEVAFACTCEQGRQLPAASVLDALKVGAIELGCALGGEEGRYCAFSSRQGKCWQVKCPKFKGA